MKTLLHSYTNHKCLEQAKSKLPPIPPASGLVPRPGCFWSFPIAPQHFRATTFFLQRLNFLFLQRIQSHHVGIHGCRDEGKIYASIRSFSFPVERGNQGRL